MLLINVYSKELKNKIINKVLENKIQLNDVRFYLSNVKQTKSSINPYKLLYNYVGIVYYKTNTIKWGVLVDKVLVNDENTFHYALIDKENIEHFNFDDVKYFVFLNGQVRIPLPW